MKPREEEPQGVTNEACSGGRGSREDAFYCGGNREEVFYKEWGSREEVLYKEQFLCVELYFRRWLILILWISDPSQSDPHTMKARMRETGKM